MKQVLILLHYRTVMLPVVKIPSGFCIPTLVEEEGAEQGGGLRWFQHHKFFHSLGDCIYILSFVKTMAHLAPLDTKFLRVFALCAVLSVSFLSQYSYLADVKFRTTQDAETGIANETLLTGSDFPRKIWQTSKTNAASLDEGDLKAIQSWLKLNQKHRFEIMTRYSSETYCKDTFPDRPDIVETYLDLQDTILRSDFIRYLVLLGDGGAYGDIDTKCHLPIDDWVPEEYRGKVNLVVGIEYDGGGVVRWGDWTRDLQFAAWAVLAKPNHLALQLSVDKAIKKLRELAFKQECTLSALKPSYREVLDATGPAMFTDAIFEAMSISTGTNVTWHNVTGLQSPRLVADTLILPINGFGAGQAHSNSGSTDGKDVLVTHLFKGSWKEDHPLGEERDYEAEKKEEEGSNREAHKTEEEQRAADANPETKQQSEA